MPTSAVIVKTVITKPAPIIPPVDQLHLRPIIWSIITPTNATEKLAKLKPGEAALFALDQNGYQNLALNNSDLRVLIQQYQEIIKTYKKQF